MVQRTTVKLGDPAETVGDPAETEDGTRDDGGGGGGIRVTSAAPCRAAESEPWSAPAPDRR